MRNKLQARSRQFKQFVFENSAIMKTAEGNPEVRMSMGIVQPIKDLVLT